MEQYKKDFMMSLQRMLTVLFVVLAIQSTIMAGALGCVFWYSDKSVSYWWWPLLGTLGCVALLAFVPWFSACLARISLCKIGQNDSVQLEKEYNFFHPTYKAKLLLGLIPLEIHLMPTFILSIEGTLHCIPIHKIERVEWNYNSSAYFIMETGKRIPFTLFAYQNKDRTAIRTWLEERIGSEKVVFEKD